MKMKLEELITLPTTEKPRSMFRDVEVISMRTSRPSRETWSKVIPREAEQDPRIV